MIESTLKIARYCPLVIQGFSNFLGLFQGIMANPVVDFRMDIEFCSVLFDPVEWRHTHRLLPIVRNGCAQIALRLATLKLRIAPNTTLPFHKFHKQSSYWIWPIQMEEWCIIQMPKKPYTRYRHRISYYIILKYDICIIYYMYTLYR